MVELEYLRVRKRFTFREYLHMFRQLFPRCTAWNWRVTYIDVLQPSGIGSGEALGLPTIINDQLISPLGIPSGETFGAASARLILFPSGIFSMESFGAGIVLREWYLYDNFDSGSIKTDWADAFDSNWSVREQSGQKIAYSNARSDRLFPPTGQNISGDFQAKFQLVLGVQGGGNTSLWIGVYDTSDVEKFSLGFAPNFIYTSEESVQKAQQTGFTPPKVVTCKIVRESGMIYGYYNDDAAGGEAGNWIREDSWGTPGNGYAFSENCYLKVDGDASYSGYGAIEVRGDTLV